MTKFLTRDEEAIARDLFETSESLYHRRVALIQRMFSDAFFRALEKRREANVFFYDDELLVLRIALRVKQNEFIEVERQKREERQNAIRAYLGRLTERDEAKELHAQAA